MQRLLTIARLSLQAHLSDPSEALRVRAQAFARGLLEYNRLSARDQRALTAANLSSVALLRSLPFTSDVRWSCRADSEAPEERFPSSDPHLRLISEKVRKKTN